MPDKVIYDAVTSFDGRPYRSEELFRADEAASMRLKPGSPVQVVLGRGDPYWSDATMIKWERIPGEDEGFIRFIVRVDDMPVMVSADRIRPKH